jgi:hypothetical protein
VPDEFLTIDEVAQRMALPPDMIRRRIESGDIPVHWVESYGKLEMRVAAEDVGGVPAAPPAPPSYSTEPASEPGWEPVQAEAQGLWAPAESQEVASSPWEVSPETAPASPELDDQPVWRPDPATWEDEQLASSGEPVAEVGEFESMADSQELGAAPDVSPYAATAEADFVSPFATPQIPDEPVGGFQPPAVDEPYAAPPAPGFLGQEEELAPAGMEFQEAAPEESAAAPGEPFGSSVAPVAPEEMPFATPEPFSVADPPPPLSAHEDIAPPSTLLASPAAASAAMGTIDARELVAGLFERWERALEQRIQAEQRLRFEAELEQRLRQVRDLRQELDQTRKSQAAELAEREREVLQLRERVRELEHGPKRRGLFGR